VNNSAKRGRQLGLFRRSFQGVSGGDAEGGQKINLDNSGTIVKSDHYSSRRPREEGTHNLFGVVRHIRNGSQGTEKQLLKLVVTTPLPGFSGDFDHFGLDVKGKRLFLTAETIRPSRFSI